jgi:putative MATE family efflux protein
MQGAEILMADKAHQDGNGFDRLGTEKIGKLLWTFSVPAIIGMLVNAIYNIVDRIYVGLGVDPLGIAAITLVMPLLMLIQSASMLIGIGANSLFAIKLGEGKRNEVESIMGNAFLLLFLVPGIVILISAIFIDPIMIHILGVSEDVYPFAKTYLGICLIGGVPFAMGPGLNHFIRSDGHPRTSMLTQLIGAVINIILDPIFIFVFKMGIAGAAWATILSQYISFLWVLCYFNSRHTKLRFKIQEMPLKPRVTLRILSIGFAPCVMSIAMSLIQVFMNNSLLRYGGDIAVTAMGIAFSLLIVCFMPLQGIGQGSQPIIGYNFGAKKYDRIMQCYKTALIGGVIFLTVGWLVIHLFPQLLVRVFTKEEGELLELGTYALTTVTMMFPIVGLQILSSTYFQAVGKPVQSTIIGMSRQLLFYLPMLLLLPRFFGLKGVFWSLPAADALSVIFCAFFMSFEWKKLKKLDADQKAGAAVSVRA